ncbi:MAG: TolC family protein [Cyclobacteriaceae bacterium]|jgi:outer membrane protein TolC
MIAKNISRVSLLLLICLPWTTQGQKIDYNTIILPSNAKDIPITEKLVQLAWTNNPSNQVLYDQVRVAEYNKKLARRNFLNQISATGNVNEFNINPPPGVAIFLPKYNFSATLSLGNVFSDPIRIKRAQEETEIALKNVDSKKLLIRAEVLRRYQVYLSFKELLKIRTEALEDAYASFSLMEQKFKNGQTSIIEYNSALENHNMRKADKIVAERDFVISKIDIEELIGVKLEDVY